MIISSFEETIRRKNSLISSINLNDQIQGGDSEEKNFLIRNVFNIRNSEKKTRDIKLKLFESPQKKKLINFEPNLTETTNNFLENKFKSVQILSTMKINPSTQDFLQISQTNPGSFSSRE